MCYCEGYYCPGDCSPPPEDCPRHSFEGSHCIGCGCTKSEAKQIHDQRYREKKKLKQLKAGEATV